MQPRISFFAWEAMWGKALTLDLIQKRWALANRVLRDLLFILFRVSWVLPSSVRETLLSWHGSFMGKKCKKVWRVAPLYIFWTVWKARNRLTFNDDVLSIQRLKYIFVFFPLVRGQVVYS